MHHAWPVQAKGVGCAHTCTALRSTCTRAIISLSIGIAVCVGEGGMVTLLPQLGGNKAHRPQHLPVHRRRALLCGVPVRWTRKRRWRLCSCTSAHRHTMHARLRHMTELFGMVRVLCRAEEVMREGGRLGVAPVAVRASIQTMPPSDAGPHHSCCHGAPGPPR